MTQLSSDQKDRLQRHLKSVSDDHIVCECCGNQNWQVTAALFELRSYGGGSRVLGDAVQPVIPLVCICCGNTKLINAFIAGVLSPEGEQGSQHANQLSEKACGQAIS